MCVRKLVACVQRCPSVVPLVCACVGCVCAYVHSCACTCTGAFACAVVLCCMCLRESGDKVAIPFEHRHQPGLENVHVAACVCTRAHVCLWMADVCARPRSPSLMISCPSTATMRSKKKLLSVSTAGSTWNRNVQRSSDSARRKFLTCDGAKFVEPGYNVFSDNHTGAISYAYSLISGLIFGPTRPSKE